MQKNLERQFQSWINRRIPAQSTIELNQRRIFIFPCRQTLYFLAVALLILIAGINYQNNLAYGLVFFMLSIFNTAILLTYANVSQLRMKAGKATPVFAGESASFEIEISTASKKAHQSLNFCWPENPVITADLFNQNSHTFHLHCKTVSRGVFKPGRFLLECFYPLGLIRCWSWLDLGFETVVYPKPVKMLVLPSHSEQGAQGRENLQLGKEDFFGFKDYMAGDSLRHVNWRSYARGQQLQSKLYAANEQESNLVDWYALPGDNIEDKLSRLCGWVLLLEQQGKTYGLRLPGVEISAASGEAHKHRILTELALFDMPKPGAKAVAKKGQRHA